MTTVHTLASGSAGNAVLISWAEGYLLVDAGISCKRILEELHSLDVQPSDLSGILITHTHGDHVSGLQTLLKRTVCPVWTTPRAGRELLQHIIGLETRLRETPLCEKTDVAGCTVTAVPTSHDAPGSCGFRFDFPDGSVGLLTDTGFVTPEAESILSGVSLALLEANYDPETLRDGSYPYPLKRRILGPAGHLSNDDASAFAVALARSGAGTIVLSHLSMQNNSPAMAWDAVWDALRAAGQKPVLAAAAPDHICGPFSVGAEGQ